MCLQAARRLTLLTWRASHEPSRQHSSGERCTHRWRGAAGVAPSGAPLSSLLYSSPPPSTEPSRLVLETGLLDHQGFTLLDGSQVLGRAWCAEPGVDVLGRSRREESRVNALGREHGRGFQPRQGGDERLTAVVISTLSRSEDWRILEHRTCTRELQLIDEWLSNSLFDVRMQICRFGQNVRRDQSCRG